MKEDQTNILFCRSFNLKLIFAHDRSSVWGSQCTSQTIMLRTLESGSVCLCVWRGWGGGEGELSEDERLGILNRFFPSIAVTHKTSETY